MNKDKQEWLITNGNGLWWSNDDGWVDKPSAARFTYKETKTLSLPIGGKWKQETTKEMNNE